MHAQALIPVGAVQQHVNFTLTASLSKPIGQRVAYAAGPCSLERLQPTPQIPSSALQQQVSSALFLLLLLLLSNGDVVVAAAVVVVVIVVAVVTGVHGTLLWAWKFCR